MFGVASTHRDHLLHALEGFAVARRDPDAAIMFDTSYPAEAVTPLDGNLYFPPTTVVKEVAFDGHFGVHRLLHKQLEPPRTVKLKSRPKQLKPHQRTCSCKRKDAIHCAQPNRTAGWQFFLDPSSRRLLGAKEHKQNECNAEKLDIVVGVLEMDQVEADLAMHDDNCHFEPCAKRNAPKVFKRIKYFVIDPVHQVNHKCSKKKWTQREHKRMKKVRSNMAESFNAWIRTYNAFLNSLRPHSHRFWVEEIGKFYNANLKDVPLKITRRSNVASRSDRKVRKKPASQR